MQPRGTEKNHATSRDNKKLHNLSGQQNNETSRDNKNQATSWDKKNNATSPDKKLVQPETKKLMQPLRTTKNPALNRFDCTYTSQ